VEVQDAAAPRLGSFAGLHEAGPGAQGVRRRIVGPRIGDQKVTPPVGADLGDDRPQCRPRDTPALERGQHLPAGLERLATPVVDHPIADAARRRAVDIDAEHASLAGIHQALVARLAIVELRGLLRPTEVGGHLRGVEGVEKRSVSGIPSAQRHVHVIHGAPGRGHAVPITCE